MGRVRLNAHLAARLIVLGGGLTIVAGVYLLWGLGVAVLSGGVGVIAAGLLLIDVDRPVGRR